MVSFAGTLSLLQTVVRSGGGSELDLSIEIDLFILRIFKLEVLTSQFQLKILPPSQNV